MPKKDTSANVLGMLSSAGAQHRPAPAIRDASPATAGAEVVDISTPETAPATDRRWIQSRDGRPATSCGVRSICSCRACSGADPGTSGGRG